jgi:hypothetical protein
VGRQTSRPDHTTRPALIGQADGHIVVAGEPDFYSYDLASPKIESWGLIVVHTDDIADAKGIPLERLHQCGGGGSNNVS